MSDSMSPVQPVTTEQIDAIRVRMKGDWPTSEDGTTLLAAYDAMKAERDRLESECDRLVAAIRAAREGDFS